ncbi:hypothetical protein V7068_03220 [Bacillus sp. JJ634]
MAKRIQKRTVAKGTLDKHEMNVKACIRPYFQDILPKDVKPVLYQKFTNHLEERLSPETVKVVHSAMHNAFEKAVTLGKVSRNPCNGVEIKEEKNKREIQFIESEHSQKVWASFASDSLSTTYSRYFTSGSWRADMKYTQERLGHGSIQITSDVYSHISKKIKESTINKSEDYIKNILE